jgi:hypothetical protein
VKIKLYYLLLIALVLGTVAHTFSVSSRYVVYGQQISQLNKEKQQYIDQKHQLQAQLNQQLSIASVSQSAADEGYTTLRTPLKLGVTAVVASR